MIHLAQDVSYNNNHYQYIGVSKGSDKNIQCIRKIRVDLNRKAKITVTNTKIKLDY